jgi:hypothetical protein
MPSRPRSSPLSVTVVSRHAETLERLSSYFDASGVAARASADLGDLATLAPETTAVVLFPDDYDATQVESRLAELRKRRPQVLPLIVTRAPHRFAPAADGGSTPAVVLPKPTFGWSLLDAIRAHAQSLASSSAR